MLDFLAILFFTIGYLVTAITICYLDPEMYLTEVIKRLPHNTTVEQAAELTPTRFAAARRAEAQAVA